MFDNKLVFLHASNLKTKEEALTFFANQFVASGLTKAEFPEKILEREEKFPTGIGFEEVGIAIPHSDPEYVIKEQIGIMTLEKPLLFKRIEDKSKEIEVSMIFMLALKEPDGHLKVLQDLMSLLQNKKTVNELQIMEDNDLNKKKAIQLLEGESNHD
ncbi:PTS sugar transporter subunit IIA [Tetragenococcus koreensis]|uniref:PTS sugar transporter IIA component n=1 Tax=Tetragenococcus koreensis TaxID=290335 RepID=A0AAN4UCX5_9ENTE|nr:PTS sugar transporter subunit IIA [Tetragenococcus koreensis]MDN6665061.1 PTS sugar transporter subunit IIA [Tetragenococcus koreensis]GEQ50134.1 PTS sugar transporter IIA component [Tetragenococcus koreensis]GEQ52615.1 PTS sugar transporter IIA component [Tetragenococcus koreensis]GEQ55150.1 PTS sugar transporter IIA component [Tetragenococcus koreensis]GEQ57616.1 PTS sugar transporter IIA component [Tetragenococcus koreensis]